MNKETLEKAFEKIDKELYDEATDIFAKEVCCSICKGTGWDKGVICVCISYAK